MSLTKADIQARAVEFIDELDEVWAVVGISDEELRCILMGPDDPLGVALCLAGILRSYSMVYTMNELGRRDERREAETTMLIWEALKTEMSKPPPPGQAITDARGGKIG